MQERPADLADHPADRPQPPVGLRWGLCIATLNRIDSLETAVALALQQSRPPCEIVIVDASADWVDHARRIEACVAARPAGPAPVRLRFLRAEARSSARQRNQGIRAAEADVLFLIDDDTFLYPDAAEEIMRIYQADVDGAIAAVGLMDAPPFPVGDGAGRDRRAEEPGVGVERRLYAWGPVRWFSRDVLLRSHEGTFVRYSDSRHRHGAEELRRLAATRAIPEVFQQDLIGGCMMTARRSVALAEPFEEALLAYCPAEDYDVCYRFLRHGLVVRSVRARAHHQQAPSGRLKRRETAHLYMSNLGYYVRKNTTRPLRDGARFGLYALRRILAEFLKDVISLQPSLPRLRGALGGSLDVVQLWRLPRDGLARWYEARQRRLLRIPEAVGQPLDRIPAN